MLNALQETLCDRLAAEGREDDPIAWMVLAAADGADALDHLLDAGRPRSMPPRRPAAVPAGEVPRTYLSSVEVRSFRGVGADSHLPIKPGRGVTLVVGRNGSGKSSFAEAVEVVFTGTSERWERKGNKEWTKGWRNVHAAPPPRLAVQLIQEGAGRSRIERTWDDPDDLLTGRSVVVEEGRSPMALEASAWPGALAGYRPFLSYSELGDMLADGPGRIYQALLAGLGLDGYETARQHLADAVNARSRRVKTVRSEARRLTALAATLRAQYPEEARFVTAAGHLASRDPDLDLIASLAVEPDGGQEAAYLSALAREAAPFTPEALSQAVAHLRDAAAGTAAVRADASGRADELARLLALALVCAEAQAFTACPVCGADRALDAAWRASTQRALTDARARATDAQAADAALAAARREVQALVRDVPASVAAGAAAAWEPAVHLHERWQQWLQGMPVADGARGDHLEQHGHELLTHFAVVQEQAREEARRRHDAWRPFGVELAEWVSTARKAARGKAAIPDLERARDWVAGELTRHRDERFAPIKQQAIDYWNIISEHSNVSLQDIELTGQGKQQRVTLKVTVDGTEAPALGVMSQGELNAMTLSLFLPRVMLPQTPFGFVLVDDPVQAMDTARVDGLAKVLAKVAESRQVIVFTHDDRLPDAFRRLGLLHQPLRVVRQAQSTVVVSSGNGPIEQCLSDATAVARATGVEGLAGRVVPGFCRLALEAACAEGLRRRWLLEGRPHDEVEQRLDDKGLAQLIAYAFFDDLERKGDVPSRLRRLDVPAAAEIVMDCQSGCHEGFPGDAMELIRRTRKLCEELRRIGARPVPARR